MTFISSVVLSALTGGVVYFLTTSKMNKKLNEIVNDEKQSLKSELLADMEQERTNILGQFSPLLDNVSSFTYENGKIDFVDNEGNVIEDSTNRIKKTATNVKSVDGEVYFEKSIFNVSHDNPATRSRNILVSKDLTNGEEVNRDEVKDRLKNQIEGLDLINPVVDFTESTKGTVRAYTSIEEWQNESIPDWTRYGITIKEKDGEYSLYSKYTMEEMFQGKNSPLEYINVKKDSFDKCFLYLKMNENRAKDIVAFSVSKHGKKCSWSDLDQLDIVRIGDEHYIKISTSFSSDTEEFLNVNFNYGLITNYEHFVKDQPRIGVFLTEDKTLRILIK